MVNDGEGAMLAAVACTGQCQVHAPFQLGRHDAGRSTLHAPAHRRNGLSILSAPCMHPGLAHRHPLAVQAVEVVDDGAGRLQMHGQLQNFDQHPRWLLAGRQGSMSLAATRHINSHVGLAAPLPCPSLGLQETLAQARMHQQIHQELPQAGTPTQGQQDHGQETLHVQ